MYIRYISQTLLYHFTASRDKNSASMKPDCIGQVSSLRSHRSPQHLPQEPRAPPPPTSPQRHVLPALCTVLCCLCHTIHSFTLWPTTTERLLRSLPGEDARAHGTASNSRAPPCHDAASCPLDKWA